MKCIHFVFVFENFSVNNKIDNVLIMALEIISMKDSLHNIFQELIL